MQPVAVGWSNVRCPDFVAQDELVYRTNGRRFEAGTMNLLGLAGLHAALELLLEVGIDSIAQELVRKRTWLVPALEAKGYTVLQSAPPPENQSAIVSFYRDGTAMDALHASLASAGIVTSIRADRSGRKYIRLSPHFYNTDAELERCLEKL
jgi:selenocysteine lyase/cysteine desulfurase